MANSLLESGKITNKGQTTVPKSVRQVLGLAAGDRIAFHVRDGVVTLEKLEDDHEDPAIGAFLKVLARDIAAGRNVSELPEDLAATLQSLAEEDSDDLDALIEGETVL